MVCYDFSNQKATLYLSYNKFVIETMNNNPINTIDLSAQYIKINNLLLNGDISSSQIYALDISMIEISNKIYSHETAISNNFNNQQFYQTVNLFNNLVNNGDTTNNIITSNDINGVSNNITDWLKYASWNTSINNIHNTNPIMISSTSSGATILLAGYYKVTVNLVTRSNIDKTAVSFRLAKNNIMEGPVSCIGNTFIDNNQDIQIFTASGTITWIFNCLANDEISIYTSRYGASGIVETPSGISSLLIEYKGL